MTQARTRKNMLPGEFRRRSTVFVERLRLGTEVARYGDGDLMTTDAYIVMTHRLDGDWSHIVEFKGEVYRLPGKVIERIIAQREVIIKEGRSVRGKDTQAKRKAAALVEESQAEASSLEAEREQDLRGQ